MKHNFNEQSLLKLKLSNVLNKIRYLKYNFLHGVKVYNKPTWFKKLWFKIIWEGNEFHPLLETNIHKRKKSGQDMTEFLHQTGTHLVKNRNVAHEISANLK